MAGVVPAPWSVLPPAWSWDDRTFRTRTPSTKELAAALVVDDDHGGALRVLLTVTMSADQQRLLEAVHGGGMATPDLDWFGEVADALIEALLGWRRWEAAYLWTQTLQAWNVIDGELMGRGVDLLDLPAGRATSVAFSWWRHTLAQGKDDEWKRFEKDMRREPRRVLRRRAAEPMQSDALAVLQQNIAAARR